jgi:phosphatidylglycerol:prolipoprotein diacylglycerol transferase
MHPEIEIGPLTLQAFGLCMAAGFIAAGAITARRLQELGKPTDWAYEMIFAALIGGLVGARIDFLIQNWDQVSDDLLGNLFSGTGLVWFGGVIGGAAAVLIWARWRNFFSWTVTDVAAVPLAVGYAIGRIGCQLSGDGDYGIPWDGPWAMAYPDGAVPTNVPVHPTPIYETLVVGLVAYALWRLRDRLAPGMLFAFYLVATGTERFLIEFLRRNDELVAGLTQAQLIALGMIIAGGIWIARRAQRGELWAPAPPSAQAARARGS